MGTNLVDRIKGDITLALRANNQVAKDVLRLVVSDSERAENNPSDSTVIKICRKVIEANTETLKLGGESQKLRREIELLRSYVPSESTLEEIQIHVDKLTPELVECKSVGKAIGLLSKTLKDLGITVSGDTLKVAVENARSINAK
jgi:uncharacterized protein YqeY